MEVEDFLVQFNLLLGEVSHLWNIELSDDSGLDRSVRKTIRNVIRGIYDKENDKFNDEFYYLINETIGEDIFFSEHTDTFSYKNKSDASSYVDTEGKYIFFCVLYLCRLGVELEKEGISEKIHDYVKSLISIHSKFRCKHMFIGFPSLIINSLEETTVQQMYHLFESAENSYTDLYEEFLLFVIITPRIASTDKKKVTIGQGRSSFTTVVSIPEFIMEGLCLSSRDRITKNKDVNNAFMYIREYDGVSFTYVELVREEYPHGVADEETNEINECSALLMLDAPRYFDDKYRNRSVLITPQYTYERPTRVDGAEPDYRFLLDVDQDKTDPIPYNPEEVPPPVVPIDHKDIPERTEVQFEDVINNGSHPTTEDQTVSVPPKIDNHPDEVIKKSAINHVDYATVVNKLLEWNDKCDENLENCSPDSSVYKEKIQKLEKDISTHMTKIKELEKELNDARINNGCEKELEKIKELEKQLDELKNNNSKCSVEKAKIKELEEKVKDLTRQLENNGGNGDCSGERKKIKELEDKILELLDRDDGNNCSAEKDKIRKLENKVRDLTAQLDDSQNNNCNEEKTRIRELESIIEKDSDIKKELQKEIDRLRNGDKVNSCTRELELTRKWLNDRDEDLRIETNKRRELERELARLKIRHQLMEEDYNEKIKEKETIIIELERSVSNKDKKIIELERKLNETIDNGSSNGEKLKAEIDRLENRIRELERELSECRDGGTSGDALRREIERLNQRIKYLERELDRCREHNNGGKDLCSPYLTEIESLKEKIKILERQLNNDDSNNTEESCKQRIKYYRDKINELTEDLKRERESDKNDSYYRRELDRERMKVERLEKELEKCYNNPDRDDSTKIKTLKKEIETLKIELEKCKYDNEHGGSCGKTDDIYRKELNRLRERVKELNDELDRLREKDKDTSYYKTELDRQRRIIRELERELDRYFDNNNYNDCVKEMEKLKKELRKCREGSGGGNCWINACEFERRKIDSLELELKHAKDTIRRLEGFIDYERTQKTFHTKLEKERERRIELENALERERNRKECGGNACEKELVNERRRVKRLEDQLEIEKEKTEFYKHQLDKHRYMRSTFNHQEDEDEDEKVSGEQLVSSTVRRPQGLEEIHDAFKRNLSI